VRRQKRASGCSDRRNEATEGHADRGSYPATAIVRIPAKIKKEAAAVMTSASIVSGIF
jgi:hypothetical protein